MTKVNYNFEYDENKGRNSFDKLSYEFNSQNCSAEHIVERKCISILILI